MRKRRVAILLAAAGFLAGFAFLFYVGQALAAPLRVTVGAPPPDFPAEPVEFQSASGSLLRGWLLPARPSRGVVILMHGVRANRLSMVDRARFLAAAGYSVLLFDFQAHGESPGDNITFGHLESRDARAAVDLVRRRFPDQRVMAIGSSLGGAAAILADPPLPLDGLVLESVYTTMEEATENRLRIRFGPLGPPLEPLLTLQLRPRLGIPVSALSPVDQIGRLRCPVLILSGSEDRHTTAEQTRRLFARAPEPKELWLVPGAAHVDLHGFAGEEYRRRILKFLEDRS
ncbi:MAG TPA: alpha/beta fold hydrolase [Thermoanaerobaculia bacterium]|nr:alpha/beta fold hydrolase [Thermoanaerobaculia bacterium]